jgi:hypothetical protein
MHQERATISEGPDAPEAEEKAVEMMKERKGRVKERIVNDVAEVVEEARRTTLHFFGFHEHRRCQASRRKQNFTLQYHSNHRRVDQYRYLPGPVACSNAVLVARYWNIAGLSIKRDILGAHIHYEVLNGTML